MITIWEVANVIEYEGQDPEGYFFTEDEAKNCVKFLKERDRGYGYRSSVYVINELKPQSFKEWLKEYKRVHNEK